MRLGKKLTKRGNNEAKFKSQPIFFKPNIYKRLKNHYFLTKNTPNKFTRKLL